jgi:hypothetical protein
MSPTPGGRPAHRARFRTRALGLLVAGCLVAIAAAAPVSSALFTSATGSSGAFTADVLDPPSGLNATVSGADVALDWTASPDGYVTGYEVRRSTTSGSGYSTIATPSGTSYTDSGLASGTYYYVVRSTFAAWTSAYSNEAAATVGGSTSTGEQACSSNVANAGGDGDGYEVTPGDACADDSVFASDMNSGTNTALGCGNAGKDKHRFWGYAFGLPGSVSSIDDITVRLDAAADAVTGTNRLCVQLSWNGGTSWTAPRFVLLSSAAETTYTMSGLWGRTWTAAQLSSANFRVRVIDASNVSTRDYFLDYAGVTVTYAP